MVSSPRLDETIFQKSDDFSSRRQAKPQGLAIAHRKPGATF
jgi:hypothetical protein